MEVLTNHHFHVEYELTQVITGYVADWDVLVKRIRQHPDKARKKGLVIGALCNEVTPVPPDILVNMLNLIPLDASDEGLGYACSNPNVSAEVLEILIKIEQPETLEVDSLLSCAIDDGCYVAIKTLLKYKPEVLMERDPSSNLFLHFICTKSGFTEPIQYLLHEACYHNIGGPTYFAGLFTLNTHGASPLHLLCEDGRNLPDLLDFLSKEWNFCLYNVAVAALLMTSAARLNDIVSAERIIKTCPSCVDKFDGKGRLPLHSACIAGSSEMIQFLIERQRQETGKILLVKDLSGISPLEYILSHLFEEDQVTKMQVYWDCLYLCMGYIELLQIIHFSIGLVPSIGIKHLLIQTLKKRKTDILLHAITIAIDKGCHSDSHEKDERINRTIHVLVDLSLQTIGSYRFPKDFT